MAGFVFNRGARDLQNNTIVWASDTIKARPVLASAEAAVSKDATTMTSLGSTGYDVTLGSKTFTEDTTNDRIVYDCADFAFSAVAAIGAIDHFIVFKFVTNDAGSTPIFKVAMTSVTPNGGDVNVTVAATGLAYTQQ
jgi:hypothetical protein